MTMLSTMRSHMGWLKWILGVVVVAFCWFYVPQFLRSSETAADTDVVASVGNRNVLVGAYRRLYQQQVESFRQSAGAGFDEKLIQQLGIGQRLIVQMVDSEAVLYEAEKLGVTVSDQELAERLIRVPGLTENGQFIGEARYRQLLGMQRPPMATAQFEEQLREQLVTEKLQAAVTGWVRVSDAEVDEEYRKRNEKVKVDLAVFTANDFRKDVQPTDAELQAQFAAHPDTYRMPEKRRVRYLAVDAEVLRGRQTVTPQEVDAEYQKNLATYSTPEQVRASHILLMTKDKDDAAVKKQAEAVLAKAKAPGADFAALAKQYSEDDTNKAKGGDLDYFGRGRMDKSFEDAAFALSKPGQISDLVKSAYGYHIIKLVDHKAAVQRSLAEVRPQIEAQLKFQKAQAAAAAMAGEIAPEIKSPADLDRVARARGLSVGDSGLFAREEPLAGLGFAPEVSTQAFSMQPNTVSGQLRTNQGFAFIALSEVKPPAAPTLAEVKDKVKDDVARLKAVDVARARAQKMVLSAKADFAGSARAAGVTIKSTELITRGSTYPEVGVNPALDAAVFGLKAGDVTPLISTDNAVVIARVKERQDIDAAKAASGRDALRSELLQQQRGTFFAAYMTKAKKKMTITFNDDLIKTLLGGA